MYFANPWGLLGLTLLPTIIFIHLYQRRFPPLEIAGLHLWSTEEQTKTAGRRLDKLPITKSLLLELLIAFLLTMLLARPHIGDLSSATHWIFVLDNSASMMAKDGTGKSFRQSSLDALESRVNSTGRNSRVSIILTGRRPTMLAGPAVRWPDAEQALDDWEPEDTRHDFHAAWDMAAQLGENVGNRVFITDDVRVQQEIPPSFELVSVGQSLSNIAFETARWSVDPDTVEQSLYLRLKNHSNRNVTPEIVIRNANQEIYRSPVSIEPQSSKPLSTELPGGLGTISVAIESADDRLETDSAITLIEPKLRNLRIAVSFPDDFPGRDQIVRVLKSLTAVELVELEQADLAITSVESKPELPTDCWWVGVGPFDVSEEARKESDSKTGPYLIEQRNDLLAGINLQGIIWSGIQPTELELIPMISVGTQVLLGQLPRTADPEFVFNVDLSKSNLADSPDWPILISNFVESCRASRAGPRRWNYRVNELIRFDLDTERSNPQIADPLVLKHGTEERTLVRARTIEIPALATTGTYQVFDGEVQIAEFAVNFFDRDESDLTGLLEGEIPPNEQTESALQLAETAPWVWMLLIAGTMIAAMFNWAGLKPKRAPEDSA